MDTRSLTDRPDLDVCACASLRRTARKVTQAYNEALKPAGLLATQFTVLSALEQLGQLRQSDLAEGLGMDGTTLTRNLRPLAKQGWIEINRDEDQRVRLIEVTDAGRRKVEEALPLWRSVQSKLADGMGPAQLRDLLDALSAAADIAHPE